MTTIYLYIKGKGNTFDRQLEYIAGQYIPADRILHYVFFVNAGSEKEYFLRKRLIANSLSAHYGAQRPAWSVVAQPPLEGAEIVAEAEALAPGDESGICRKSFGGTDYISLDTGYATRLYLGGITVPVDIPYKEQCETIFHTIRDIFSHEGIEVSSIVRQWNYLAGITEIENGSQHYQDFNNARSVFYSPGDWTAGYPAATGIGTAYGGVVVDLEALVLKTGKGVAVKAVDNKLQTPAFAYSGRVLAGCGGSESTTPKFERAKAILWNGHGKVYVSGTAAIRGEESLEGVGAERQTEITIENIDCLISRETLRCGDIDAAAGGRAAVLRVYLKNAADMDAVRAIVSARYTDVPSVYLLADVCRDNLLVEIEGVAGFETE